MKQGPRYRVKPRRRREGRTDYRRRIRMLKSGKDRMVVRKSLKNIQVQFVRYSEQGDQIIASAVTKDLVNKFKWKYSTSNTPAAYLTGLLAGTRALDKNIKECILDMGLYPPVNNSKIFAVLKGALDAGVKCNHDESKIPSEDRLMGKHLDEKIESSVKKIKNEITGGK